MIQNDGNSTKTSASDIQQNQIAARRPPVVETLHATVVKTVRTGTTENKNENADAIQMKRRQQHKIRKAKRAAVAAAEATAAVAAAAAYIETANKAAEAREAAGKAVEGGVVAVDAIKAPWIETVAVANAVRNALVGSVTMDTWIKPPGQTNNGSATGGGSAGGGGGGKRKRVGSERSDSRSKRRAAVAEAKEKCQSIFTDSHLHSENGKDKGCQISTGDPRTRSEVGGIIVSLKLTDRHAAGGHEVNSTSGGDGRRVNDVSDPVSKPSCYSVDASQASVDHAITRSQNSSRSDNTIQAMTRSQHSGEDKPTNDKNGVDATATGSYCTGVGVGLSSRGSESDEKKTDEKLLPLLPSRGGHRQRHKKSKKHHSRAKLQFPFDNVMRLSCVINTAAAAQPPVSRLTVSGLTVSGLTVSGLIDKPELITIPLETRTIDETELTGNERKDSASPPETVSTCCCPELAKTEVGVVLEKIGVPFQSTLPSLQDDANQSLTANTVTVSPVPTDSSTTTRFLKEEDIGSENGLGSLHVKCETTAEESLETRSGGDSAGMGSHDENTSLSAKNSRSVVILNTCVTLMHIIVRCLIVMVKYL